ncbi:DUF255 domain-containing protein [Bacillus subtilis]|nr:DUF255 domain-containing protein [Bacillus subtilis]WIY67229.1 DUF255 domain-containing protein [Bacillus subtilis]
MIPCPHNRPNAEKSPYLLQHAHNPVNWFPWGEEAFEKAKRENKPFSYLLGITSRAATHTCHWCHVIFKYINSKATKDTHIVWHPLFSSSPSTKVVYYQLQKHAVSSI